MHKKEIRERVIRQQKKAHKTLRAFIKKGDQEQLHRFRTSIKKLRAVTVLVEEAAPAPQLRLTLKSLRKTYRLSGEIRDSYLHLGMGKATQVTAEYHIAQQLRLKEATGKLLAHPHKHEKKLQRSTEKLLENLRPVKNLDLNMFYEQELQFIGNQLILRLDDEDLHSCRKRIKILLYNLPLVKHVLTLQINETYLDQVQTAIGDWHDNLLAATVFTALKKKTKPLRAAVNDLAKDFYNRATIVVDLPLAQID